MAPSGLFRLTLAACVLLATHLTAQEATPGNAEEPSPTTLWAEGDHLFGDWSSDLEEKGYAISGYYVADFAYVLNGAIKNDKGYFLGELGADLTINTTRTGWWSNGTFYLSAYLAHGGDPSLDAIGDWNFASNIEDLEIHRISGLWYSHSFNDGDTVLKGGYYNVLSDFCTVEAASTLLNFGAYYQPELYSEARAATSSRGTLAASLDLTLGSVFSFRVAVQDGAPSDPQENRSGLEVQLRSEEGLGFWFEGEARIDDDPSLLALTLKLGFWTNTGDYLNFEDFSIEDGNQGFYFIADSKFAQDEAGRHWAAFMRFGLCSQHSSFVTGSFQAGATRVGTFEGRDQDKISVAALITAFNSDIPGTTSEAVFEFTYLYQVTNFFALQADYQHIKNPGGVDGTKDADVFIMRASVTF